MRGSPARLVGTLVVATTFLSGLVVFVSPVPALASDCNEYGLAVQKINGQNSYGTYGTLYAYKQQYDSCGGPIAQTQLIILSSDNKSWVEAGYRVYRPCGICGPVRKAFGEWGFSGCCTGGPTDYGNVTADTTPSFKVSNVSQFGWSIYWDSAGGTNWTRMDTYNNMYASVGWALGEVSKHGSSGTVTAYNHEWNLHTKGSSGSWSNWGGITCPGSQGWDTLGGWEWDHFNSNTEFSVIQGPNYC